MMHCSLHLNRVPTANKFAAEAPDGHHKAATLSLRQPSGRRASHAAYVSHSLESVVVGRRTCDPVAR
ncbi:hypothetical protein E2C01_068625 [Portunus trituberculatus]|uniref:Uncharacterized protein n=1 Tax=Portunus trituberculatus TaxID=210409 RepID=A0A5B7HWY3_PORTR|nr:hypothetical protein [Portunus trituberculatus]